jgi:tetratricopeptide (TPR) repeat protein
VSPVAAAVPFLLLARVAGADAAVPDPSAPPAGPECFAPPPGAAKPQELTTLRALIEASPAESPDLPDLLLRLGRDEAAEQNARHLAALARGGGGQPDPVEEQRSLTVGKDAARHLSRLVTNPRWYKFPRLDEALAILADLLVRMGRADLARPLYKRLVKDYPSSPRTARSYAYFGDYYLEQEHDPAHALQFFEKVLAQWPDSPCGAHARAQTARAHALPQP